MERLNRELSPSLEDYLKTIFIIEVKEGKIPRTKELSSRLGVKASSVTSAIELLTKGGFVEHERYGCIKLTPKGKTEAEKIFKIHSALKRFFRDVLGVEEKIADRDACAVEHFLHPETFSRLLKFLEFIETCPNEVPLWLKGFHYYVKKGQRPPECNGKAELQ